MWLADSSRGGDLKSSPKNSNTGSGNTSPAHSTSIQGIPHLDHLVIDIHRYTYICVHTIPTHSDFALYVVIRLQYD